MSVVKIRKPETPFEIVDRASVDAVKDPVALAIWVFLRCKPEGWIVREAHVRDQFDIGRDRYRSAMRVLIGLGLVEDRRIHGDLGRIVGREMIVHYAIDLAETPDGHREPENPSHGHREPEKPVRRLDPCDGKSAPLENSNLLENTDLLANIPLSEPTSVVSDIRSAACPHFEIIDLYHEMLPELQGVVKSLWHKSDGAKDLQGWWRSDKKHQSLDFWERFFNVVRTNPHWMGHNDRGWKADLRWLIKKKNFIAVAERMANLRREAANG